MADPRDYRFMALALQLAGQGLYTTDPNPRVGCVLAKGDAVVATGFHCRAGAPHAEVLALEAAGPEARGSTAYVTLEPCCHVGRTPPCTNALIEAGIVRVVAATRDPHLRVAGKGFTQLRRAGIAVEVGVMADDALALNRGFFQRHMVGRPWVRCKMAMSLDGRTAMASGESRWITAGAARNDVQHWRARASAIATGVKTVLWDDPRLNQRLEGVDRQPLRVIFDPHLATPPTARVVAGPGKVLIFAAPDAMARANPLTAAGAEVMAVPATGPDQLDLAAALGELGRREINELHLEGGATLAGAFVAADLVDEWLLYIAPILLGSGARGAFALPELTRLDQAVGLHIADLRPVGGDWRLIAHRGPLATAQDLGLVDP
ncbi:MAG: bifunctional diaminohydroxyphosphoribosylaminopyrimidine deaminase/5-amino-6-(5-phosphoribosylamino)uracil reductase RibD [Candidatus Competibacterales bacterium]